MLCESSLCWKLRGKRCAFVAQCLVRSQIQTDVLQFYLSFGQMPQHAAGVGCNHHCPPLDSLHMQVESFEDVASQYKRFLCFPLKKIKCLLDINNTNNMSQTIKVSDSCAISSHVTINVYEKLGNTQNAAGTNLHISQ